MTAKVQQLLNTFDTLTYSERLDLLSEILRRTVYLNFESLSDDELTLNAEEIFLTPSPRACHQLGVLTLVANNA